MPFRKRRSLAIKIPLLTSLLLLAALAAMSVASYLELRGALVELASGRLEGAATQMASVFGMNVELPFHVGVGAFWVIIGVMIVVLVGMTTYFRRRGFL